jgi:hypothetical protein
MNTTDEDFILLSGKTGEVDDLVGTLPTEGEDSGLGVLLGAKPKDVYSFNDSLEGMLTLRYLNSIYGKAGGCKYGGSEIAEFDRCITKGCISPMRRFNNIIGHFMPSVPNVDSTHPCSICLQPEMLNSIKDLSEFLNLELGTTIRRGRLWSLQGCYLCKRDNQGIWTFGNQTVDPDIGDELDKISISFSCPLSVHSHHAWLESDDSRDTAYQIGIFKQPEETTAVTSLLGTLQNNQIVDLSPYEPDDIPNMDLRLKDADIPTFLCKGHTSHSTEAGRVRRVCCDVYARVLSRELLDKTIAVCNLADRFNKGDKDWTLFCMGKMCRCSFNALVALKRYIVSMSSTDIQICTLDINMDTQVALLSISSGVLLRRDLNGGVYSSTSLYADRWPNDRFNILLPSEDSDDALRFYFSGFFQLIPYICFNRPPRTVISSVQSQQAVAVPYGAGTSSVAPTHISKPCVSTALLESVMNDESAGICDYIPGEDLVICYANFNDTYEDSVIMSEGSVARGLYSYMGYSSSLVGSHEKVPEVGEYVSMSENPWWKVYSRRNTYIPKHSEGTMIKIPENATPLLAGGDGRGRIIAKSITQTGDISIKILRFCTPVTGDKLASGHGQKGVLKLWKDEDMPWGIDEDGNVIRFDMVMSLASITNRLTNGHYYEMVTGVKASGEGRRLVIQPSQYCSDHTETTLYDGKSGQMIMRGAGDDETPVLASWGICRIWQMTQLSWDKQHYTHNIAGRYSITTPVGRSAGGGVKFGEMETHAVASSGLTEVPREIKRRIDTIDISICATCESIIQICNCGDKRVLMPVSIPHSMLVFDYSNILTSGFANKYRVTF